MMLVIRVYDESGNVIETQEHKGDFRAYEMGLRALQICYQIPHPVSTRDVHKDHFCSICCCR